MIPLISTGEIDILTLKYTFWLYNPRFWHKNIPFDLMTHVESVVCLTRKELL